MAGVARPVRVAEGDHAVGPLVGVGDVDVPVAFVNGSVVMAAEQDGIGDVSGAPGAPGGDVMGIGMGRRPVTAREPTPAISKSQQTTL